MPGRGKLEWESPLAQESLEDRIDYDKLGDFTPDNKVEEKILETALNSLTQAIGFNQEYLDSIRNSYDETKEMIGEFYPEK